MILRAIAERFPKEVDAKHAITLMKDGASPNWRQMEWIGFYPEFWFASNLAIELDVETGPRFGNVTFDLARQHVWDLKAHSTGSNSWAPLNDVEAVTDCIRTHGGVGFFVLSGPCTYDEDGTFKTWHDQLKGGASEYSNRVAARGGRSRRRKIAFQPDHLIAFRFSSIADLTRARNEGWIKGFQAGMQNSNGRARRAKIMVDLDKIADWAIIEEIRR